MADRAIPMLLPFRLAGDSFIFNCSARYGIRASMGRVIGVLLSAEPIESGQVRRVWGETPLRNQIRPNGGNGTLPYFYRNAKLKQSNLHTGCRAWIGGEIKSGFGNS